MTRPITAELVIASAHCPRKGFLLSCTDEQGIEHEYVTLLEQQKKHNQARFYAIHPDSGGANGYDQANLCSGRAHLTGTTLHWQGLEAECAALTRVSIGSSLGDFSYEPTIVTGTYSLTAEQKIQVSFAGLVLGHIQTTLPQAGRVVGMDSQARSLDLRDRYKDLRPLLETLHRWMGASPVEPPPVVLNKHCPLCQFRTLCRAQAEKADDLSLLDHMTPKVMQRYQRKGIFTVRQLSYLFRPRKKRIPRKGTTLVHRLELQALALRMGKIYLQEAPDLTRQPTELFLDIEGIPDQQAYYLIGLLVREGQRTYQHFFWADTHRDEQACWHRFLTIVEAFADAPIYHYGSYDATAVERMASRYQSDAEPLMRRLVNLSTYVYGKVYYPTRSNSLKDIGQYLGAVWTAPEASGPQSLVWRHRWEESRHPEDKHTLILYNKEDCGALTLLVDDLIRIAGAAAALSDVDFADTPKRIATERGEQLHGQFDSILLSAHATYAKKKIALSRNKVREGSHKQRGPQEDHRGYRKAPHTRPVITRHIAAREMCPRCIGEPLRATKVMATRQIVDLVFTTSGCRKTVTEYIGPRGYCPRCTRSYSPHTRATRGMAQQFGHSFQSWVIYQRLVLRLPYPVIVQALEDQFNEHISQGTIINFLSYFFHYYAETDDQIVQAVLRSPFIHVDETRISIRGIDQYVWVFTNGTHVFFRITKTRETAIVREILLAYTGVLISDFYGGYDAVGCRQQKCLVHLIRDLNQDLWDHPLDDEFERFVVAVGDLITPMLADAQRYGLKVRHLRKHKRHVVAFYGNTIDDTYYKSELVTTYQKRFDRYRHSMFTFLEEDGIPWNNNMAERGIRHLAIQRKISGSFYESVVPHYLRLLGIMQTCRFQEKSLLKFLVSGQKDINAFKSAKGATRSPATPLSAYVPPHSKPASLRSE